MKNIPHGVVIYADIIQKRDKTMKCSKHGDIENWEDHPECPVCKHLLEMYCERENHIVEG
jgi:hypothetical protein